MNILFLIIGIILVIIGSISMFIYYKKYSNTFKKTIITSEFERNGKESYFWKNLILLAILLTVIIFGITLITFWYTLN